MKVSDLGEFNLIELIAGMVSKGEAEWSPEHKNRINDRLILGIGDDTAAWRTGSSIELITTDTMVQNVHFTLDNADWEDLGWKIMAVNISDIAAMGGIPYYALVTLCLPGDIEVDDIRKLYKGMINIGSGYGIAIVGGDIVRSQQVVITVNLTGTALNQTILKRSTAIVGDRIAVTGTLGAAGAGLQMFKNKLKFDSSISSVLRAAHLKPIPRIIEGNILVSGGIRTAMDISDGLVDDLSKLCKASKVEARLFVDQIPVNPIVKTNFKNAVELALSGGEDYELLFTGKMDIIEQVKKSIKIPVTVIGEILNGKPGKVTLLDSTGKEVKIDRGGWDHFQKNS